MRPRPRDPQAIDPHRWRQRLLEAAGLVPEVARAVAHDDRYDLHEVLGLLERGCPPSLALDIAAPLDDRRPLR